MTLSPSSRRLAVSLPVVATGLPLLAVTAPIWILGAIAVDLATGLRALPSLRLGAFAVVYLAHEWVGVIGYAALTVRHRWLPPIRRSRTDRGAELIDHRRIQAWWAGSLLRWAGRLLGVRFDLPEPVDLPPGGVILLSRHASIVDAMVPVIVVSARAGRFIQYVMKEELQWVPTLALYSRRLGNHFVARGDLSEAAGIARFAAGAIPDSVLTIFPEGTYATPATRRRVRSMLRRRGPADLATLAADLRNLLPPRPAGTLALLRAQPGRDVVVLGHVGLEHAGRLVDLRRRIPLTEPVVVRWWHHPRPELPSDRVELLDWLNGRWRRLDTWIDEVMAGRRPGGHTTGAEPRTDDGEPRQHP